MPGRLIRTIADNEGIDLPVNEDGKTKKLDESKVGRNIKSLCYMLWEAGFKELRVDLKKKASTATFFSEDGTTQLDDMTPEARAAAANSARAAGRSRGGALFFVVFEF